MKTRGCYRCNLKALLLFLVIVGHAIEGDIGTSLPAEVLYRCIYLFHMPLFVFLSGMGIKGGLRSLKSAGRTFLIYAAAQGVVALWTAFRGGTLTVSWVTTPYWHLWYLLSLAYWYIIAGAVASVTSRLRAKAAGRVKLVVFLASIAAGALWGFIPYAGRPWSLSRTVAFLPFLLAGAFWGESILNRLKRAYRLLPMLLAGCVLLFFLLWKLPVSCLYHAAPYRYTQMPGAAGALGRLGCYAAAACFSAVVLILCPKKKLPITAVGADTLWLYLLHPLVVLPLRRMPHPPEAAVPMGIGAAAVLMAVTAGLLKLRGQRYRFVTEEGALLSKW